MMFSRRQTSVLACVTAGPILSTADIMQEEQYQVRGMFQEAAPPSGKPPLTVPAIMPLLSGTPGRTKWAGVPRCHMLSQHIAADCSMLLRHLCSWLTGSCATLAGPDLGHHTDEVLRSELGMDDADIARLREIGAI